MISATITDQLARVYREARVLVLGDRSPKVDRAFALHREFIAVRASFLEQPDDARSEWEATLLEKTRRATIVALRHQALAVRDRWAETTASLGSDQSSAHVNPEHAVQLATAAMELHVEDDPDADRTTQAVEVIRQSLARAKVSASPLPSPQGASLPERLVITETSRSPANSIPSPASRVVLPSDLDLPSVPLAGANLDDPIGRVVLPGTRENLDPKVVQASPRAATSLTPATWSLLLLTAAGFAFFAIGKSGPLFDSQIKESAGSRVVTEVRRPRSTPRAVQPVTVPGGSVVTEIPRPLPSAVRLVTVLLKSQPNAATVTVGGEFRGTTPLSLDGKPGQRLSLVMQKGDWVWRGTLTVDETGKQIVTIRLAPSRIAQTPRRPTSALPSGRTPFEATLRAGIELYKQGWFGPAAGRFKQALTIDPRSAEAYLWWGRALLRADRQAEARRALEKVIALAQTGPLAQEATALLSRLR